LSRQIFGTIYTILWHNWWHFLCKFLRKWVRLCRYVCKLRFFNLVQTDLLPSNYISENHMNYPILENLLFVLKNCITRGVIYYHITGSVKANRIEPKTCLGQVCNYKLGCFEDVHEIHVCVRTPTSIVENSAQVSSC